MVATGRGPLEACTNHPELFSQMPGVKAAPFRKTAIDHLAHYSRRKHWPTTQWEDVCIEAGVKEPVPLRLDWQPHDQALVDSLKDRAAGRPVVLVQLPRAPMGRTDGFGHELLPDCRVIQQAVEMLRGRALLVQIGAGRPLFEFKGLDVNLAGRTTVPQLLDIAKCADGLLGYVSFIVPLAEVFDKRALLVWSRRGLKSSTGYIRQITPAKILHKKETSKHVVDDCKADHLEAAVQELLRS
jgi:ADP-heptose:LPS heptosyltransferase